MRELIQAWLKTHAVTRCPERAARGHLYWYIASRPTHQIPLSLGIVGRW